MPAHVPPLASPDERSCVPFVVVASGPNRSRLGRTDPSPFVFVVFAALLLRAALSVLLGGRSLCSVLKVGGAVPTTWRMIPTRLLLCIAFCSAHAYALAVVELGRALSSGA